MIAVFVTTLLRYHARSYAHGLEAHSTSAPFIFEPLEGCAYTNVCCLDTSGLSGGLYACDNWQSARDDGMSALGESASTRKNGLSAPEHDLPACDNGLSVRDNGRSARHNRLFARDNGLSARGSMAGWPECLTP